MPDAIYYLDRTKTKNDSHLYKGEYLSEKRIRNLLKNGCTIEDIALLHNINPIYVKDLMIAYGITSYKVSAKSIKPSNLGILALKENLLSLDTTSQKNGFVILLDGRNGFTKRFCLTTDALYKMSKTFRLDTKNCKYREVQHDPVTIGDFLAIFNMKKTDAFKACILGCSTGTLKNIAKYFGLLKKEENK